MSDLYNRIEEFEGIVRVLTNDVRELARHLGERSIAAAVTDQQSGARRSYIRAVFALIEAITEQHKRLLLELAEHKLIALPTGVIHVLTEQAYLADENGSVMVREQFLELRRKLRTVNKAAGDAFGHALDVNYGNQGWQSFVTALKVRHRVTHPKSFEDCQIAGWDLDQVDSANDWFRDVHNKFIEAARTHRKIHSW